MIQKSITIDLWQEYRQAIELVQHEAEGRTLNIALTNGGQAVDLTECAITFNMTKGAEVIYNACTITDATAGKISLLITGAICDTAGTYTSFIEIVKTDDVLRTRNFNIKVNASEDNSSAVESKSEFTALTEALALVSGYRGDILNRVIAPATNTDAKFPQWDGTNSKTLKDGYTLASLISAVKQSMYRVGDIIMSVSATNPSAEYGGTWVAWGTGRVPVSVDTSQTEFNTVEKTGGEKTHTLVNTEIPQHNHSLPDGGTGNTPANPGGYFNAQYTNGANGLTASSTGTGNAGAGQAHNNLQPYITCYMWKRTA